MISKTLIIGVTGGVGSGKGAFVRMLRQFGADTLDADALARRLVKKRTDLRDAIRSTFGDRVFNASGSLNRRELGRLVFSDFKLLRKLNMIMWPPLLDLLKTEIQSWRMNNNRGILAVDMAILFEADAEYLFDKIVLITAPEKLRIERLHSARSWTDEEIRRRMKSQFSDQQKMNRADCVIDNSASLDILKQQAELKWMQWKKSVLN